MFNEKIYAREYRKKHLEKIRKTTREWARENPQPYKWTEGRLKAQQKYRLKHKEKIAVKRRVYFHKRLENDIQYKLMWLLRSRVMIALKSNLANKAYKTIELLGCSIEEARQHIENQFEDWMTWENHGLWEIDHIKPVSSFNLILPEEQKKCFHYTNLQPLIKQENRTKSNRMMI